MQRAHAAPVPVSRRTPGPAISREPIALGASRFVDDDPVIDTTGDPLAGLFTDSATLTVTRPGEGGLDDRTLLDATRLIRLTPGRRMRSAAHRYTPARSARI